MRVLELFSGIGGMHYSLNASGIVGEVVAAADINTIANSVYLHNFPSVTILQKNIQSFSADFLNHMSFNMILMSPPCQPYTRVGLQQDCNDNRSCALSHITSILPDLNDSLKYILLENVKGFENSLSRDSFVKALEDVGFVYKELLLSPMQFGVPNSRERYYLLASRTLNPLFTSLANEEQGLIRSCEVIPKFDDLKIGEILEIDDDDEASYNKLLLGEAQLKRTWVYDIVMKDTKRSCCFTKAYSHYAEGTGSIYCPYDEQTKTDKYEQAAGLEKGSAEYISLMKSLKLRYFTPREIANLMCFPRKFSFPDGLTTKQKYRLLGNSLNVHVVSGLIKLLCGDQLHAS